MKLLVSSHIAHKKTGFMLFLFLNFEGHKSFLWGHWYPCFGLLVTSALGFTDTSVLAFWWCLPWVSKPGWISSLACFLTCTQQIPQIHLWCNTCLFHQQGVQFISMYTAWLARLLSHALGVLGVLLTVTTVVGEGGC